MTVTTIILTPEQSRVVEEAGDQPVRVVDPVHHRTDILLRNDVYQHLLATGRIRQVPGLPMREEDRQP
jgi:hypothetical protein